MCGGRASPAAAGTGAQYSVLRGRPHSPHFGPVQGVEANMVVAMASLRRIAAPVWEALASQLEAKVAGRSEAALQQQLMAALKAGRHNHARGDAISIEEAAMQLWAARQRSAAAPGETVPWETLAGAAGAAAPG